MSSPSTTDGSRDRLLRIGAVLGGLLVFLYGVVVAQQILAAVVALLWAFVVYLLWRFVRAHERLAGAAERIAGDGREPAGTPTWDAPESSGDDSAEE